VSLYDGFKTVTGDATVVVHPTPSVNLGPDATVCVFDTLIMDAYSGIPGSNYIWSNGSTDQVIKVATTGIGFDFKTISVTVTSPEGCFDTDERNIVFDFAACNGIDDQADESGFHIYPNPGNGIVHVENLVGLRKCLISVTDIYGRKVMAEQEITFSETVKTYTLDLSFNSKGIYFIRISDNGKNLVSLKYLLHGK
jgi:hypothetical protein